MPSVLHFPLGWWFQCAENQNMLADGIFFPFSPQGVPSVQERGVGGCGLEQAPSTFPGFFRPNCSLDIEAISFAF